MGTVMISLGRRSLHKDAENKLDRLLSNILGVIESRIKTKLVTVILDNRTTAKWIAYTTRDTQRGQFELITTR